MLAFVIPLLHPNAAKHWPTVTERLQETLRSVAACAAGGKAFGVLVANREARLPPIPDGVTVLRVDYAPPNVSIFLGEADEAARRDAVFLDKGSRIAFGAIHARDKGASHIMLVDADDLVSDRLPEFVAHNATAPGWFVSQGWLLPVARRHGLLLHDFHQWCGTSMIVRTDLLGLEDEVDQMDEDIVRFWFGNHRNMIPDLIRQGHSIEAVPFPAAVYRTGHSENHYKRGSLFTEVFAFRKFRERPLSVLKKFRWIRRFRQAYIDEFHRGGELT